MYGLTVTEPESQILTPLILREPEKGILAQNGLFQCKIRGVGQNL